MLPRFPGDAHTDAERQPRDIIRRAEDTMEEEPEPCNAIPISSYGATEGTPSDGSLVEPTELRAADLTCSVFSGGERKALISEITATFAPATMTALMGPRVLRRARPPPPPFERSLFVVGPARASRRS